MKFLDKEWKGKNYRFYIQRDKNSLWIHYNGQTWLWKKQKEVQKKQKQNSKYKEIINSALPGRIQNIFVKKGDKVKKGDNLLTMSAMKIEYNFKAESEGQVEELFCKPGQTVDSNQQLIKMKYF